MKPLPHPPPAREKRLFTPGPLTTSRTVKEAMLHDAGSRDTEFVRLVAEIRTQLLVLAGTGVAHGYEAIPMQGSGTFGVESVVSSVVPPQGKLLVLVNGAYGERIVTMAQRYAIPIRILRWEENQILDCAATETVLKEDAAITHVAAVHCETTSGILNPIEELGPSIHQLGRLFIVDAMSSFGAVPLHVAQARIDYLISSANKCIEGVPGFSFILARREALLQATGLARTLSLDLLDQWHILEKTGQFRFTPPTHALLAFAQALRELAAEGGPSGRSQRYRNNHQALLTGMLELGFRPYLPAEHQSCIITTFHYPADPAFRFETFYQALADRGFLIYPGKLTRIDGFRIGTIGRLYLQDIHDLLKAIRSALHQMRCSVPLHG